MAYKGKFKPNNLHKYKGDPTKIRFLSLWERCFMRYLDNNDMVKFWNSEDAHIKYICRTDGKEHTYMIDFYVEYINGEKDLIEIKPKKQTIQPKKRKGTKYLTECYYYAKNISKWEAARKFAELNGVNFKIFTEDDLRKLGIPIITNKNIKSLGFK